jgi:uncharacterized protein (TIGR00661 family)
MRKMTVLYSVLDWGLGHATRSIPLIQAFLKEGHTIILAGEGRSALLLKKEFPQCQFESLQGFKVNYPEKGMAFWALRNFPAMLKALVHEKKQTAALVKKYEPDLIISDHRYGFYHPEVHSIFIAHQLRIRAGVLSPLVFHLQNLLIKNFNAVWIPDYEVAPGLSGELAHHPSVKKTFSVAFTGPLSRLQSVLSVTPDRKHDILILLSGPEPQRTILENICITQLKNSGKQVLLIQGKPESDEISIKGNITIQAGVSPESLKGLLETTPILICRPGYSTIMDLDATGRNAILIPTPGQTEQEYLAGLHVNRGCMILDQKSAELNNAIQEFKPLFNVPRFSKARSLNEFIAQIQVKS